ncbi:uncharacterized protein LOC112570846 [Pomacea canaliculata]|uniref:uncharacterized protein LOC112570846 n=1 Tax=Pomacea canaliculata TaxID=400727 RepID=UPI000D73BF20|nr:uncharacterized protein LOC112570846 [Pomacea canaliculata]
MSDTMDFAMLLLYCKIKEKKRKARQRKWWVRPWIERRMEHGAYHALMQEMAAEDGGSYRNFVRMDRHHFELLLTRITPHIKRQDSNMRECISPGERLAVTLRFLATGDSYHSLSFLYRLGRTTVGKIIPETCKAITAALKDQYLKVGNDCNRFLLNSSK